MLDIHKLDSLIKQKGYTNIALSKILESYGIKKNEATIRKYRYGINDPEHKNIINFSRYFRRYGTRFICWSNKKA